MGATDEKELKSLDDFNADRRGLYDLDWGKPRPNGIACPSCGTETLDSDPSITLTSHPPEEERPLPRVQLSRLQDRVMGAQPLP